MDNETILAIVYVVTVVILIVHGRVLYRHGIWDGAFNQFLPHVQDAMREYDADRAEQILAGRQALRSRGGEDA
jgi:hypothetical protein